MFETFDHTADIGIRATAPDLASLLAEMARGFTSLIVPDPLQIKPDKEMHIRVDSKEPAYLLFDWLNELLYLFDTQRMVFCEFHIETDAPDGGEASSPFSSPLSQRPEDKKGESREESGPSDGGGLSAVLRGEVLEPTRHQPDHEIKAITYHQLIVQQNDSGWMAEVIVDV